eukprot:SM000209S06382  [mRNA]  locus=s209:176919:179332:- [translate_table: standard]
MVMGLLKIVVLALVFGVVAAPLLANCSQQAKDERGQPICTDNGDDMGASLTNPAASSVDEASEAVRGAHQRAQHKKAEQVAETLSQLGSRMRDTVSHKAEELKDHIGEAYPTGKDSLRSLKEKTEEAATAAQQTAKKVNTPNRTTRTAVSLELAGRTKYAHEHIIVAIRLLGLAADEARTSSQGDEGYTTHMAAAQEALQKARKISEELRSRASALQGNLTSSVPKGWLTRMFGVPKRGPHTSHGDRLQADPAIHWNTRMLMVLRFVHLLSFCLAFGTAVWTTYYEPVLLRQALPKSKASAGFASKATTVTTATYTLHTRTMLESNRKSFV